jgi:hypothetical protein
MNDTEVAFWGHGSEELTDELCVRDKLGVTVREDVEEGIDISIPSDGPI